MQSYKRKITYFYQYHNGTVGSTAGFMKLEIRGDKVKIIINIQEPMGLPYKEAKLYIYHEAGDHLAAIKVDNIESVNGVLTYQKKTDWQNVFHTERDLYTFDGMAVAYSDSHYYIGDFADKDRRNYELVKREPRPTIAKMVPVAEEKRKEEISENKIIVEETEKEKSENKIITEIVQDEKCVVEENAIEEEIVKEVEESQVYGNGYFDKGKEAFKTCENCPYQEKRKIQQEDIDAFEKMVQNYPKLPMYGATELFDCVRIHPRDIGKLDMRNWKLGVNSFLTHGFYTYQYLLLGKMRFEDGSYRCIIGVPGVYSSREKYLADMFGFDQFIPVKKTGIKTGEFGYWIVEIIPSL